MHWRNRLATLTSLLMLPRSTSWSPVGMSFFLGRLAQGRGLLGTGVWRGLRYCARCHLRGLHAREVFRARRSG